MRSNKVSILIPVYNVGPFLRQCLDSVVCQTYRDLQICIINDGSTDNSDAICREYASVDPRIEYVSKANEGVAATRNRLLDMVQGDYVLFVDSDDWIELDMVEYLIALIRCTDSQIACCRMIANEGGDTLGNLAEIIYEQQRMIEKFLYHREVNGSLCNKLIDSSLLNDVRFPHDISYGEDAYVCWQILQHVDRVVISNRPLYHYRMNDSSISHQPFGPKKLSANRVWQNICDTADREYPALAYIGHARWGMEATQLLLAAAKSNVKANTAIKLLQSVVREKYPDMIKSHITSLKGLIFAILVAYSYTPFRLILGRT